MLSPYTLSLARLVPMATPSFRPPRSHGFKVILRVWRSMVGSLIELFVARKKPIARLKLPACAWTTGGAWFHRLRDFKQYYFNSIPPTSHIVVCYTILYNNILYYTIYYNIVYHDILYYTILYYTILYYTILYYTMICYINYTIILGRIGGARI